MVTNIVKQTIFHIHSYGVNFEFCGVNFENFLFIFLKLNIFYKKELFINRE